MSTIDKEKFQFVKRDDFASETIGEIGRASCRERV